MPDDRLESSTASPGDTPTRAAQIHVVIPFFDGHEDLPRLLRSIDDSTLRAERIWIVDNSDDDARISESNNPRTSESDNPRSTPISIVSAKSRIGFGRACNLGAWLAAKAGATHICLLNQDGFVDPSMLAHLLADIQDRNATLIAPLVIDTTTQQLSPFVARLYVPEALQRGRILPPDELPQSPRDSSGYLCGAALFFRTSLLHELGLFDPLFTMYGEDRDLCERARAAGGRLALSRAARFFHAHTNANARGKKRVQLLTWQSESHAARRMRTRRPSPIVDLAEETVLWARSAMAAGLRSATDAVRSRRSALATKAEALRAARDGEPLLARISASIQADLIHTGVLTIALRD